MLLFINPLFQFYIWKTVSSFVLLLLVFLSPQCSIAQNQKRIDSIKQVLPSKDGIERYELLIDLVFEYVDSDYNLSLKYIDEATPLALLSGDSLRIVRVMRYKGSQLRKLDKPAEAVKYLKPALSIAERNQYTREVSFITNLLALAHTVLANYDMALEYNFYSLSVREKANDKPGIGESLSNIGFLHYKIKNYKKALEYFLQYLKIGEELNDERSIAHVNMNIGLCYCYLGDFLKAKNHLDAGFKICGNNCAGQIKINGEFGYGVAYYFEKEFPLAEHHFINSYGISTKEGNQRFQADNLVYLGRIKMSENKIDSAERYFLQSLARALSGGYRLLLMDNYYELTKLYKVRNDYVKSSIFQEKYIAIRDSILGEDVTNKLMAMQAEFEQRQNLLIISHNEDVLRKKQTQVVLIGIIACLLFILAFALVKIIKIKQDVNRVLDSRVQDRTNELELSKEALHRSHVDQIGFFEKTVHDIKSPLATLKGVYATSFIEVRDEVARHYMERSQVAADELDALVSRLDVVNKLNQNKLKYEQIDMVPLIHLLIKDRLPAVNISLKPSKSLIVYTDRDLVTALLNGLIGYFDRLAKGEILISLDQDETSKVIRIKSGLREKLDEAELYLARKLSDHLNLAFSVLDSESEIEFKIYFRT